MDSSALTLEMLWSAGLQLVVFYHCDAICQCHFQLWSAACIPAPWHNTVSCHDLVSTANFGLATRRIHPETFHVTQGILTPDGGFIASHLGQKLRGTLAGEAMTPFLDWLRLQKCGCGGINIVSMDFIESTQLVSVMLDMNRALAHCLKNSEDSAILTNS